MAPVKFSRVISVSTEDPKYSASNLLNSEVGSASWKTKNCGEEQAVAILELEQPVIINSVDVGNENSMYVEIYVARSASPDNFKSLVVPSVLMSLQDAKSGANKNTVRFFKEEELVVPTVHESWDRVKIVCAQPYNKHIQYGLRFIKFYSKTVDILKNNEHETSNHLGRFAIKSNDDDNSIPIGSFFARRKDQTELPAPSTAAAIREASNNATSSPLLKQLSIKKNLAHSSSNFDKHVPKKQKSDDESTHSEYSSRKATKGRLLYDEDETAADDSPKSRFAKHNNLDMNSKTNNKPTTANISTTPGNSRVKPTDVEKKAETPHQSKNKTLTPVTPISAKNKNQDAGSSSKISTSHFNPNPIKRKPFNKLLEGLTFVISGYQNPYRSELRSKILEMGGKYKADWDRSCTHLICAYANTPKYNQVRGKGRIVRKDWIEDCYSQRKRIQWKNHAFSKNDIKDSDSDEEILEAIQEIVPITTNDNSYSNKSCSDSDTEDEIERVKNLQSAKKTCPETKDDNSDDVYNMETDVEEGDTTNDDENVNNDVEKSNTKTDLPYLPDFFNDINFYLDPNLPLDLQNSLARYIIAYKGKILHDLPGADYVISEKSDTWTSLADLVPTVVHPSWIWDCNDASDILPITKYIV